jgi:hypothetical protein
VVSSFVKVAMIALAMVVIWFKHRTLPKKRISILKHLYSPYKF